VRVCYLWISFGRVCVLVCRCIMIVIPAPHSLCLFWVGSLLITPGSTVCGTTDSSSEITALPRPHEEEIQFILEEVCLVQCVCIGVLISMNISYNHTNNVVTVRPPNILRRQYCARMLMQLGAVSVRSQSSSDEWLYIALPTVNVLSCNQVFDLWFDPPPQTAHQQVSS